MDSGWRLLSTGLSAVCGQHYPGPWTVLALLLATICAGLLACLCCLVGFLCGAGLTALSGLSWRPAAPVKRVAAALARPALRRLAGYLNE